MDTTDFMDHIINQHGFGTGDATADALGLSSPATRAYHAYLHRERPSEQDHTHTKEDLGS